MSITWSAIKEWRSDPLADAALSLERVYSTLEDKVEEGERGVKGIESSGDAIEVMKVSLADLNTNLTDLARDIEATARAVDKAVEGVDEVKEAVAGCLSVESFFDGELRIDENGIVTSLASGGILEAARRELQDQVDSAVEKAREVDSTLAACLAAIVTPSSAIDHSGILPTFREASPENVALWWDSLTDDERERLRNNHPEDLGNLDGLPVEVRDKANRTLLEKELAAARGELESNDSSEQRRRVDDLEALHSVLEKRETALVFFDPRTPGEDVRAAVAVGDVDNADNIVTLTPGIDTTVRENMDGWVANAQELRNSSGEQTAAIAFLGYDSPPGIFDTGHNGSEVDILGTANAREGAKELNDMHEGIVAHHAVQGRDPRVTLVGHSYGSTVSGIAASEAEQGIYDSLVLHGSPGSGVQSVEEYAVPEGRVYNSTNTNDKFELGGFRFLGVPGIGPDATFGKDPREMEGVTQIHHNDGGHSDYWNDDEFVEDVAQIATGEDPAIDRQE